MAQSPQCPKCASPMSGGYIIDKTDNGPAVSTWVEGEPKKSFWVGLKLGGATPIDIETWRCRRCGFLESYAPGE